jgi:hypothetical protein
LNRSRAGDWTSADEKQRKDWRRSGIVPADYPNPVAADYPDLLAIVEKRVKPERDLLANGDATARDRARRWWQFARPTRNLYLSIARMERVFAAPRVSKYPSVVAISPNLVASEQVVIFASSSCALFSVLQSGLHQLWTITMQSSLETRGRYTPSDCFETFPFPEPLVSLGHIGERYDKHRQAIMQARQEGLTTTLNRFHDSQETAADIAELRRLHVEMDQTVAAAYGWQGLDLGHDFHETKQGIRFTVSEAARREVLDRLLALNHQRHADEVAAGSRREADKPPKRSRKKNDGGDQIGMDFDTE